MFSNFIVILPFIIQMASGAPPEVRLANARGQSYTFAVETKEDLNSLVSATQMEDPSIREVCNKGVWVLYTLENFRDKAEIFPYVDRCETPYYSVYRSVRSVGSTDDITQPKVAFFSEINLTGDIISETSEGVEDFLTRPKSLVAINTDVEFFRDVNYSGPRHCLDEKFLFRGHDVFWAWHFDHFGFDISDFKSAKVGCSEGSKLKPSLNKHVRGSFPYTVSNPK